MNSYIYEILLLCLILYHGCLAQDQCTFMSSDSARRYFNLADKAESISTGSSPEVNVRVKEEYSDYCPEAGYLKYRTFNGTCNNLRNRGASFTPQGRLITPAYDDGVNSPRQTSVNGRPLPNARSISLHLHPYQYSYSDWTIMVMAFGQFIDHDLVSTPVATRVNSTIKCCVDKKECSKVPLDPDCFPIMMPSDEYVFSGKCVEFLRSLAATDINGDRLSPRKQLNTVTSFLDASVVYGSTNEVAESLKDPDDFLLKTKDKNYLPDAPTSKCVKRNGTSDYCFLAGDTRVNQHPFIGVMHTLFLREHNRIARQLRILRPDLPNKEIFQMARRIVIARFQAIVYNTWLPIVLGHDVDTYKLRSEYGRCSYNEKVDPSITSDFAAAAFRFGHSTIPTYFPIGNKAYMLRYLYNTPFEVFYNFDDVLKGVSGLTTAENRGIQKVDQFFVHDVSRFLFLNNGTGRSLDLVSINVHRGRDNGLPPYVNYRAFCGLRPLTGFDDTEALGPNVGELARIYNSVEDIDLYTGMLHEPIDTGLIGPTARCVIALQFQRLKLGDRFFFATNEKNTRFTDAQLMALRRTTLSDIICQNSYLHYITKNVFLFESRDNPLIPCARVRDYDINLTLFV